MNTAELARVISLNDPSITAAALVVLVEELKARVDHLEAENLRLRDQSVRDELTRLLNRRGFEEALDRALQYRRRYGGAVALLAIDLDGMKRLNDTHGHPAGDAGLRAVGEVLKKTLRGTDSASRLGGDEFAVVLPGTGTGGATHVAERIRRSVAALPMPAGARLTASIGVATTERAALSISPDELWSRADGALYTAKRNGKNRVEIGLFDAPADGESPATSLDRRSHEVLARLTARQA